MKAMMFLFMCLMAGGCHSHKASDKEEVSCADSVLVVGGTKKLHLKDGGKLASGQIRYYEEDGKSYLVHGYESQKKIRIFDYKSGEMLSEVGLDAGDGEFYAHHPDTAFVVANGQGKAKVDAWLRGERTVHDIRVRVKKGHIEQFPRCWANGAVQVNGKWYFSCSRIGEYPDEMKSGNERFPLLEMDLERKVYRFVGAYPEVYASNNMGTLNYWAPELCRGTDDGKILVGFKASPEMLVYSPATGESRFESVKSVYADTVPLPLTEKGRDYFSESDSYYYYAQYSHYGPISHDPWRKIYYRFVGIGLNDWELEPSPRLQLLKKWAVMVFDESFHKLGEQYLGDAYRVDYHFVSPDGLYLLNKGKDEYTLFKFNAK